MTPDALDITVGVILFLSMLVAYFRGIIREVFTIVALCSAFGASYFVGPLMIPPFEKWLNVDKDAAKVADQQAADAVSKAAGGGTDAAMAKGQLALGIIAHEHLAQICAYASVFLFIYFVMSLIGFFLTRAVAEAGLTIVDRLLGAGFGLARGFIVVFLLYLPAWYYYQANKEPMPDWAKNSVSVPVLEKAVDFADTHLGMTKLIQKGGDELAKKLQKRADKLEEKEKEQLKDTNTQNTAPPDTNTTSDAPPDKAHDQKELEDELKQEEKKGPPQ
jgi:uncharacterized membrane protein required for colicin V production